MSEVAIKFFFPDKIAFMEKEGPRAEVTKALEHLSQALQEKRVKPTGPPMALLHIDPKSFDPQKMRYEACCPISGKVKGEGALKGREIERGIYACLAHSGPIEKLPESYAAILKWIEENGYRVNGSIREVYEKGIGQGGGNSPEFTIEIQFPVRK
jgi:effector-binding domain-containing protein